MAGILGVIIHTTPIIMTRFIVAIAIMGTITMVGIMAMDMDTTIITVIITIAIIITILITLTTKEYIMAQAILLL